MNFIRLLHYFPKNNSMETSSLEGIDGFILKPIVINIAHISYIDEAVFHGEVVCYVGVQSAQFIVKTTMERLLTSIDGMLFIKNVPIIYGPN